MQYSTQGGAMNFLQNHWRAAGVSLLCLLLLGGGFLAGRRSAPERVVTVTQTHETVRTVEVEKKATQTQTHVARAAHRTTKTVTTRTPDGTTTTTRETTTDTHTAGDTSQATQTERSAQAERTIDTKARTETTNSAAWRISGLVGLSRGAGVPSLQVVYGGHVERRLFGPVTAGAWFLTSGAAGVSLGVEF
jgi:hypothetical protein